MKAIPAAVRISALIGLLFSASSFASTVVYTQAPTTTASGITSDVLNLGGSSSGYTFSSDYDSEAWTYFGVGSGTSFNQVTWYGTGTGTTLISGNFAVGLTAVTSPVPGNVSNVHTNGSFTGNLLSQSLFPPGQVTVSQVATGLYSYTVDLSSLVTLGASPYYALSVVYNYNAPAAFPNTGPAAGPFLWATSTTGGNGMSQTVVGTGGYMSSSNLAFTLSNTGAAVASPVPEPPAYALLLAGLGMIRFLVSRRKGQPFSSMAFA